MNDIALQAAILGYLPLKAAFLFVCGFLLLRLCRVGFDNVAELVSLSLSVGFGVVYLFMLGIVFAGAYTFMACAIFVGVVAVLALIWLMRAWRDKSLSGGLLWLGHQGAAAKEQQMGAPFEWLIWGSLVFLAVMSAAAPSLDNEVFRWLRPMHSALQAHSYVVQPEEIMFWLPQTAQFIDGFTLALTGEISFVAADRVIGLVSLYLSLKALSIRVFKRDLAPLAMAIILANETAIYLFPHAFLKGHVFGAILGLSALQLYLATPLARTSGAPRLLLTGALSGIAASVTFHSVFLIVGMGLHALIEFLRERFAPSPQRTWLEAIIAGALVFVPALFFASVWIARNIVLTGDPTYPYGTFFPASGGYGAVSDFWGYLQAHLELAKPSGLAFQTHTIGPFIVGGFFLSLFWWRVERHGHAQRFFGVAALVSTVALLGSYVYSNISPRYYMYWVAILSLVALAPVNVLLNGLHRRTRLRLAALGLFFVASVIGLGLFIVRPTIDHLATTAAIGDFRRITPQPASIVEAANAIHASDPNARWATPLMLGGDYYLKPTDLVSYGWPTFPTALELLSAETPEAAYAALQRHEIRYVMFFAVIPTNLYRVYDWNPDSGETERIEWNGPHRPGLRQSLAVFEIDADGRLISFDGRHLVVRFVSEPHCAYPDESGCLGGEATEERHYVFEVREQADSSAGWIEAATLLQASPESLP